MAEIAGGGSWLGERAGCCWRPGPRWRWLCGQMFGHYHVEHLSNRVAVHVR